MTKSEKIRLFYGIFLSVLTVAVGIVFIAQIADIYYSGPSPYTPEAVREHALLPLIFLFVWIAAIIAGFVLSVVFPVAAKRKTYVNDKRALELLSSRMPTAGKNEEFDSARKMVDRQRKLRIVVWSLNSAVLITSAIYILLYAFNPRYFASSDMQADILRLVLNIMIVVGISIICSVATTIYDGISIKREIESVKAAIKNGDKDSVQPKNIKKNLPLYATIGLGAMILLAIVMYIVAPSVMTAIFKVKPNLIVLVPILFLALIVAGLFAAKFIKKYVPEKAEKIMTLCTRIAVGVIAVAFIIAGVFNGGADAVLGKAIMICMECVGIG